MGIAFDGDFDRFASCSMRKGFIGVLHRRAAGGSVSGKTPGGEDYPRPRA